ncbi:hypothetical protein PF008_g9423 [Phytophthora fragariae]|uniref:C3H1-type domain-containing protein n=1 Tax=Phytophthora fragariae TaxID=53985 RepID=A0A6G0RYD0_9STRA|nr:hypothetical protein PF008_g9423 [Phytophthora fragariae]
MQRGQVAVASAYTSPSNQLDQTQHMPQHWTPPARAGVRPPSPPPDDQDRTQQQHYRHPMSLSGAGRRNATGGSYSYKHKKPKPCSKLLSGFGCPYGDKCHFSHDIRAFYPALYEYGPSGYDDPIWSAKFAAPPRSHQSYPQRQTPTPANPPMPKSGPARYSSTSHMPPQRDRAASFACHSKPHDNQTDGVPMSSSGKMMFKEAVLRQSKMKLAQSKQNESSPLKTVAANGYGNENGRTNREITTPENEYADTNLQYPFQKHNSRHKKFMRGRKGPPGESAPSSVNGDSPKFCRNPKYLFSEVDGVDLQRGEAIQQLSQPQQQQYYPVTATQLLNSFSPPYSKYVTEEQFHSNLSKQLEGFVDYIDAQLASREMHQQQAIDSLQELVRSLWPDAMIDVYGSSYTRLALPVSDIDCVLVARSLAGEQPLTILEALAAEVERQPWTKQLELLGSAKIPVLRMTYSLDPTQQDVLLDLTCGHSVGHTGLGARDLIYSFQAEMPALRPLVLILKSHLLRNDLKCAFTGGISSYVLVILVIRFLQACGDTHHKSFASASVRKVPGGGRRRSYSDNASRDFPEELAYSLSPSEVGPQPKWCYTFSRNRRVMWRTGIGSLLMLFLETYITFDYRHFGISIENEGEFFLLPPEKVVSTQCSVVIPYVADPIKPGRSICNCFRMHEVIQAWLALYQNLCIGSSEDIHDHVIVIPFSSLPTEDTVTHKYKKQAQR